ncbi:MAG: hypothetical protein QNJ81_01505 [Acidimicrobiia bacterium]|nr:hypothetical protein [Acidimicrobiia bacterium]
MRDRFESETIALTRAQEWYVSWTVDLLIYTVVLNLFDEYVAGVTIESFTLSILAAALLKVILVLLGRVEYRVHHYFAEKGTTSAKVVGAGVIFAILFGGKLLILEVVDLVFGDEVELGHIVEVVALILAMMIARRLMNLGFKRLGGIAGDRGQV